MRILFLDQTGQLGGAEFVLRDIAQAYRDKCLVVLFSDGPFRLALEKVGVRTEVLPELNLQVRRETGLLAALSSVPAVVRAAWKVRGRARKFDLVYANTQKALLLGALATALTGRRFAFHLHDILSAEHFSSSNARLSTAVANRFCDLVIADSEATKAAFIAAGGKPNLCRVIYYGFEAPETSPKHVSTDRFLVGHFSRISPWKGQDVLLQALAKCSDRVEAIFVGSALFGEEDYAAKLKRDAERLGLAGRISWLGFRDDVADLMAGCDLVVHSSTAPEPFGRVIVEAMLVGTPVIAARSGGPTEIIIEGYNGTLFDSRDADELARLIGAIEQDPSHAQQMAREARQTAVERFSMPRMLAAVDDALNEVLQ